MRVFVLLALLGACRDKVDRDELKKATGLANAPPVGEVASAGCPAGAEIAGAARPRGVGQWCQAVEGNRVRVYRLDGTLWAEGQAQEATGLEGEWKFYAPGGKLALVRTYDKNITQSDDVKLEGVELPPTTAPVCFRGWTGDRSPTTTKCPPQ